MAKFHRSFSLVVVLVLVLLMAVPAVAAAAPVDQPVQGPPPPPAPCCWYQVHWGDTLSKIAARYGVSTYYLQTLNGIHNPNYIRAGQWLRVPCYQPHPVRNYYYSYKYHCYGYSYYNTYLGRWIYICTKYY